LLAILEADFEHAKTHTRLLVRALEWERADRNTSHLLTSSEIADAEQWVASATNKEPIITPLHSEYIVASRKR